MYGTILIAIDDSLPSQYAIDVGLVIAEIDRCAVKFCVVLDPALLQENSGFFSMCQLAELLADELLESAHKRAKAAGIEASSLVLYQDAADGVIEAAKRENSGLIVVGTHGRSGIARAFTRSIAEEVLRRTTMPLCVIRRAKIGRVTHRLLVPIVDDALSGAAATYATDIAKAHGSELVFFTACDANSTSAGDLIAAAVKRAAADGVRAEGYVAEWTRDLPDQIVQNARAMECDAIVMASHARDGFLRLVEGSVTEAVIRSSEMPIFVIRDPKLG